jgi:penicillin-binding protein 1A
VDPEPERRPRVGGRRTRLRTLGAVASALLVPTACSLRPVDLTQQRPLPLRSTIVAADGRILARLYKQNRAYVPLARIPRRVVDAVLAAEDARFFEHGGFDLRSMARAALTNLGAGTVLQGGSTITQQYVKNTYFRHPERTFFRKARELRLALEVERRYSKEEILERYLNTVYFGEGAYGVKAASEVYFGHGLGRLSTAQAALLASVIRAPSAYDPRIHPRAAEQRRDYVLARMATLGALPRARARRASDDGLGVTSDAARIATRDPYFVEAVRQEILRDARLGPSRDARDKELREGGLRVHTTLQPKLQAAAEDAVGSILDRPGDPEAALIAIRPRTGRIVAMVGGRDWSSSQVNLALGAQGGGSGRQPGSSFKPIVAAAALEAGIGFDERYESSPTTFHFDDGSSWVVGNAEGGGYGLLPLDEALVHSVNGVYARLGLELGPGPIATLAHLMGVRSPLPAVPSIALGSDEVSVLDMASVYATIANHGTAVPPTTIRSVRLADGTVLPPRRSQTSEVIEPGNAYLLTEVLQEVIERGTGTAAAIGRPAAGKTGTTNDYADAWFVGYTPQLVAAVWVGYPEGRIPMTSVHGIRVMGGTFPALIWRSFMARALADAPVADFTVPASEYVTVEIDPDTGLRAAPWCPGEPETMLRQLVPTEVCPPLQPREPTVAPTPSPTSTPTPEPTDRRDDGQGKDNNDQEPAPSPSPSPTKSRSSAPH